MGLHNQIESDAIANRRKQAWKLRVKAWSIRDIADHLGVSVGTIHSDLEAVRKEVCDETKSAALKHREVELSRLDEWIRAGTEQLESLGDIRSIEEAASDADAKIRVDTIAPLLNSLKGLSERRSKLLGLDSAVKTEVTVDVTQELNRLLDAAEKSLEPEAFDKVLASLAAEDNGGAGEGEASVQGGS